MADTEPKKSYEFSFGPAPIETAPDPNSINYSENSQPGLDFTDPATYNPAVNMAGSVGGAIVGGAAGAGVTLPLLGAGGPAGAFVGGVTGGPLLESGYRKITGQPQKDVGELGRELLINAAFGGAGKALGAILKPGVEIGAETLTHMRSLGYDSALGLSAKQIRGIESGQAVKLTKPQIEALNMRLSQNSVETVAGIAGSPELKMIAPEARKALSSKEALDVFSQATSQNLPASELQHILQANIDDVGRQLGEARKAITTPVDANLITFLRDEIKKATPAPVTAGREMANEAVSGYVAKEGTIPRFFEPILRKGKDATVGDIIDQYKAVSDELSAMGYNDLTNKIAGVNAASATKVVGDVEGLKAVKKVLKKAITDIGESSPDVKLANDLANKYAALKEAEPYIKHISATMAEKIGMGVAGGIKDPSVIPNFAAMQMGSQAVQGANIAGKVNAATNAISSAEAVGKQNASLPTSLALYGSGSKPGAIMPPEGLRATMSQGLSQTAPMLGAVGQDIFNINDAGAENPTPALLPRAGQLGPALGGISAAISQDMGPMAAQIQDKLQEAMASGSDIEQSIVMGSILAVSPKARALFEPGITPAKSEFNGIIADKAEKGAMLSQLRNATKAGLVGTIEAAEFQEKLNTNSPFSSVPKVLRRNVDRSLAPLLDPYGFVTPTPK